MHLGLPSPTHCCLKLFCKDGPVPTGQLQGAGRAVKGFLRVPVWDIYVIWDKDVSGMAALALPSGGSFLTWFLNRPLAELCVDSALHMPASRPEKELV